MLISRNELLIAIKATLTKNGPALPNDRVVHGQLLRQLNGYFISSEDVKELLETDIESGYFTAKNNLINITALGIEKLNINI